jgi:hypothetical protein
MSTMSTDETVGYDVFVAEPIPQSVTGVLTSVFIATASTTTSTWIDERKAG